MPAPGFVEAYKRLARACEASGLGFRNWSGGGEWVFAIYTRDDSFLGSVEIRDGKVHRREDSPWYKKDAQFFEKLRKNFA